MIEHTLDPGRVIMQGGKFVRGLPKAEQARYRDWIAKLKPPEESAWVSRATSDTLMRGARNGGAATALRSRTKVICPVCGQRVGAAGLGKHKVSRFCVKGGVPTKS